MIFKKTTSIILVIVFLFEILGYHAWYRTILHEIHREIKLQILGGKLKNDELTLVIASKETESEIHWIKHQKEFRYRDEMYDVVRIKVVNNKKQYYCICDKKEQRLVTHYNKINTREKKTDKRKSRSLNIQLFFNRMHNSIYLPSSQFRYARYMHKIYSGFHTTTSPPPKMV